MCGIIGYTGYDDAKDILIKGLMSLEYRGYDSAGIAVYHPDVNGFIVAKSKGRVGNLGDKITDVGANIGIGHTRWATHGTVSDENSHPHKFGCVTIVHNGIIENYESIKKSLGISEKLKSQTDSEVVAALIDKYFNDYENPEKAIISAAEDLKGTYALGVVFDDIPEKLFAVRNVSPIVCCIGDNGAFIASDVIAIKEYSDNYFVLPEHTVAEVTKDKITVTDFNGNRVIPKWLTVDRNVKGSGKCGYPFYMEKEICEQPEIITRNIESRLIGNVPDFSIDGLNDSFFDEFTSILVIACGTAMHSGLIGKYIIEKICSIPVNVCLASEFIYSNPIVSKSTLVICVSQSGETADTLAALKYAKSMGAKVLSVVNVRESSIARESDSVIYTDAGPEIAVASTKAYTSQVTIFYLIAAKLAYLRNVFDDRKLAEFVENLKEIPDAVKNVIDRKNEIHKAAERLTAAENTFMIGRGLDYPVLQEGSLKLKEISYIHSEAFAAGELKHGTIALITENTPVIALLTQRNLASKQLSSIREVESRGGKVIAFVSDSVDCSGVKASFTLPEIADDFSAIPAVTALQLLAYYVSADKGLDVDKPRNLAKVVTVE